jgi:long-chain acyl-CoA synthetase
MTIFEKIQQVSIASPDAPALQDHQLIMTYAELVAQVEKYSLTISFANAVGILIENSPAWVIYDLACLSLSIPCVPIPSFFSDAQILHAINDAGVDLLLTDQPDRVEALAHGARRRILNKTTVGIFGKTLYQFRLNAILTNLPKGTVKITYTSGTTGQPKGVCLSEFTLDQVAQSLKIVTQASANDRHLCVLPLATLLENVAGIYVPLLSGACINLMALADLGLFVSAKIDFEGLIKVINQMQITTFILTPELLRGLLDAYEQGAYITSALRFIAVGGAHVPDTLLSRARKLGMPIFEGYGLSECASVVALNTPSASRTGSVGKLLPHTTCKIAKDGEILIKGSQCLGYSHAPIQTEQDYLPTGDIGYLDQDQYLYITGRKKNIFITSYGRNVSPDWVEGLLVNHATIFQAALFGEGKPFNVVVLVIKEGLTEGAIFSEIMSVNSLLPPYARVQQWIVADAPFLPQNGLATANFRLKREAIYQRYQTQINACYRDERTLFVL